MPNKHEVSLIILEFAEKMNRALSQPLLDDWVECMAVFAPSSVRQGFMTYFNSSDVRYGFPAGPGVITGLLTKEEKIGFSRDQMACRAWGNDMTPREPNCACVLCWGPK